MSAYHINPKTGNPGVCHAKKACPFGDKFEHYSTKEEARDAYESNVESQEKVRVLSNTHSFGGSTARNTEITEAGSQALVIALARGKDINQVKTKDDLIHIITSLPKSTKNYEELLVLAAKLSNDKKEDEKIQSAVQIAQVSYSIFKHEGLNDKEIIENLRWMAKESTHGTDGTVGDIGITVNGKDYPVSIKSESNILHNGSVAKVGEALGLENFNLYNDERVESIDNEILAYYRSRIESDIASGKLKVNDLNTIATYQFSGTSYDIPLVDLKNIHTWKATPFAQKTLSKYITKNWAEIGNDPEYIQLSKKRQVAVNSIWKEKFEASDSIQKREFIARLMGLRNTPAYYVNHSKNEITKGRIPTIEEFVNDERIALKPIFVSKRTDGLIIPIHNKDSKSVSFLKLRTRFTDGQMNYKNVKANSSYVETETSSSTFMRHPALSKFSWMKFPYNFFSFD